MNEANNARVAAFAWELFVFVFIILLMFHLVEEASEKKHVENVVVNGVEDEVIGNLHLVLNVPRAEIGGVDADA